MPTAQTRADILDAAERLFAQNGFAATSIREITREAAANVAAVHYHFGNKQGVLIGVTDRVVEPLNQRRFELLDAALRRHDQAPLDEVIDAFIRPDFESLQRLQGRGPTVAHFLGQVYSDRTPWIREMTRQQFAAAAQRFYPAIGAQLPELTDDEIAWRMNRVAAILVHLFATWPEAGMSASEAEYEVKRLVRFVVGALRSQPIELADDRQGGRPT